LRIAGFNLAQDLGDIMHLILVNGAVSRTCVLCKGLYLESHSNSYSRPRFSEWF